MELKFDEKGLIPAIVQDHYTKEVLTLAYMNKESLAITIDERRTCFWSRSRQELWRKGETSGNVQHVVSITADCDGDALVVEVVKDGPACHTGAESCFFNRLYLSDELKQFSYEGLYELIRGRKTQPKEGSYTTYLFEKGIDKILKKVGEESTEVIIAAAGKAAHLAGVIAGHTTLPVIGIPIKSSFMDGLDSLLSTVQMPTGIPVATVAVGGGDNAAYLAAQMLSIKYPDLAEKLLAHRKQMAAAIEADDRQIQDEL